MQGDDEPVWDALTTDLEGREQQGAASSSHAPGRWHWGLIALLLVALLAAGDLMWAAKPLLLGSPNHSDHGSATVAAAPTPVSPAVFASLGARSLHLPAVPSLALCPVSIGREISPEFGLAAGTGPLYIVAFATDSGGSGNYSPASAWGDHIGWGGMPKTLWIFPSTFSGPVLIRGQRLDSAGEVRFDQLNGSLLNQLQITVSPLEFSGVYQAYGTWYIRFNAPGCYGLQIDWLKGTERIIFRAKAGQAM